MFGLCCAILRTRERPASTKRRRRSDSASRDQSVCEADSHRGTALTMSGHERNGSRLRSRRLSPRRPLHWPQSGFKRTKITRLVARSHRASCKAWYHAANAATVFIALRRGQVRVRSTTIVVSAPTHGADLAGRCVIAGQYDKIFLMRSYGVRSSNCWRVHISFKKNWNGDWLRHAMPVPSNNVKRICRESSHAFERAWNV